MGTGRSVHRAEPRPHAGQSHPHRSQPAAVPSNMAVARALFSLFSGDLAFLKCTSPQERLTLFNLSPIPYTVTCTGSLGRNFKIRETSEGTGLLTELKGAAGEGTSKCGRRWTLRHESPAHRRHLRVLVETPVWRACWSQRHGARRRVQTQRSLSAMPRKRLSDVI